LERRGTKAERTLFTRASISFPTEIYEQLERLAKEKKVSLAWIVRDAAEKYLANMSKDAKKR
jgi:predicted DNA-binding protein